MGHKRTVEKTNLANRTQGWHSTKWIHDEWGSLQSLMHGRGRREQIGDVGIARRGEKSIHSWRWLLRW